MLNKLLAKTKFNLQDISDNLYDLRDKEVISLKIYDELKKHRDRIDVVITDIILRKLK